MAARTAGIVSLSGTDFSKDIMDQGVDADRRMLDFLVGLDTEFSGAPLRTASVLLTPPGVLALGLQPPAVQRVILRYDVHFCTTCCGAKQHALAD